MSYEAGSEAKFGCVRRVGSFGSAPKEEPVLSTPEGSFVALYFTLTSQKHNFCEVKVKYRATKDPSL